jgi:hypothetical protein
MVDGFPMTHAFTCIGFRGNKVKVYDSLFDYVRWFPRDPSGLGHPVYSENDFKRYQVYTIYELRAQPVNAYFEEKIHAQMTYVMSGDRTLMDERESRLQSQAALKTN